ncbi:MAP7 domain-containing 2-like isoform X1 [Labeo rohita]|uniref:MAP7 domain-containing 2-like isoform X1 n=1 Tax=Labeo rohita TaxID=84645 RepID=A0A498MUX6_LABRO|nr:MAP7 domain-containing 2-like isoform X1 [Labeo rohita]
MATIVENLTDGGAKKDKIRLAKERREEKDRSQAVRERALLEKEQRAQQQYERSVVERGRRLEEQRQKEMLRRSAVEEKRRQRMEEDKERLEALMRRSVERNLQADQRPKRWTWGGPPGVCDGECVCVCVCVCACEGVEGPLCELLSGPWGAGMDGDMKTGSKSCKSRIQSPASPGQYPPSPMRHRATTPSLENKKLEGEEKGSLESKGSSTLERKTSRTEKITKSSSKEFGHNGESPVTPTGKAGTTDAEEASRLLAERRRLARVQKEQEEKQRLEEERLRAEELQRQQEEERQRQEQAAREAEEKRQRQEEERCQRELEERHQKEQRWKELQDDLERQSISPSPLETEGDTAIISPPKAIPDSPIICLEPLEAKSCLADDLSDGVQSMDVSPVSRDELVPEYSPVSEISQNSMTSVALGDIHVLTGQVSHPKVSAPPAFGDCNKNLIQDCSSAAIDSSLFQSLRPTSDKLNI